jgi:hypothetical protein
MRKSFIKLSAVAAVAFVFAVTPLANAADMTVTPTNTQGWTQEAGGGGSSSFVADPSAPGESALQLVTSDSNDAYVEYHHSASVPLSQAGDLSYATKTLAGPAAASASYALGLDTDNDGVRDMWYVYEPYWQVNFGGQAIVSDTWQTWNIKDGMFWSTADGTTEPSHSWTDMVAAHPGASLVEVAVYMGSYNPSYTVNVDTVNVNGTVYNFQTTASTVPVVATNKDQCKKDGWKQVVTSTGKSFKNQGQCVAYVESSAQSRLHRL